MAKFTDSQGKDWIINITIRTAREIKQACGFDLLADLTDIIEAISKDSGIIADICYYACKKQIVERGMNEDDFFDNISGSVIDDMAEAFFDGLRNFIPSVVAKEMITQLLIQAKKTKKKQAKIVESGDIAKAITGALSLELQGI